MIKPNLFKLYVTTALMAVSLPMYGEAYKWTDSSGEVHYSQTPPENVNATPIAPPPSPPTNPEQEKNRIKQLENQYVKTRNLYKDYISSSKIY